MATMMFLKSSKTKFALCHIVFLYGDDFVTKIYFSNI